MGENNRVSRVSSAKLRQENKELMLKEQKERTKFYAVLGIFIVVVVAYFLWSLGSAGGSNSGNPFTGYVVYAPRNQTPACTASYISVCCLDENSNNICDSEEERIAAQKLVSD